jgi:hypothetical protein
MEMMMMTAAGELKEKSLEVEARLAGRNTFGARAISDHRNSRDAILIATPFHGTT